MSKLKNGYRYPISFPEEMGEFFETLRDKVANRSASMNRANSIQCVELQRLANTARFAQGAIGCKATQ